MPEATTALKQNRQWQSSAPANTMILGEHSVVYGYPALAAALDQLITIHWQARPDNLIQIHSALADFQTDIHQLGDHPQLKFVMEALRFFQDKLPFGLEITIKSDFSSTIGLGSSAAVLAAMLSGLNKITQQQLSKVDLFEIGHQIILKIQGRGSGTDLAASLMGGLIYFEPKTAERIKPQLTPLQFTLPIVLIYSGYKTPTAEVLAMVAEQWQHNQNKLQQLYQQMGQTTQTAFKALENQQTEVFYQACSDYQQLMTELGVNDDTLQNLIALLNQCPSIESAKISGSGLGDCVIGLGSIEQCPQNLQNELAAYQKLQVNMTPKGATTFEINPK